MMPPALLPIDDPMKAELAAAEWMRRLGYPTAWADGLPGADGGIDVEADNAIGQVKHYSNAVGIAEIQRLYGIAQERQGEALFFALNGYSSSAIETANRTGVLLFSYTIHGLLMADSLPAETRLASYPVATDLSLSSQARPDDGAQDAPPRKSDLEANQLRVALMELTSSTDRSSVYELLEQVDRPMPELTEMAERQGPFRDLALASPWCSRGALAAAAADIHPESIDLRIAVASNPRCPPPILDSLATSDPSEEVRAAAVTNPDLSPSHLRDAVKDSHPQVRRAVAARAGVTSELLRTLATDPSPDVRIEVAQNPATPDPVVMKLMSDPEPPVREAVAKRARLPSELILQALDDRDEAVRSAAKSSPAVFADPRAQEKVQTIEQSAASRKRLGLLGLVGTLTLLGGCIALSVSWVNSATTVGSCVANDLFETASLGVQNDGDQIVQIRLRGQLPSLSDRYVRVEVNGGNLADSGVAYRYPVAGSEAFKAGSQDIAGGFDNELPSAKQDGQTIKVEIPTNLAGPIPGDWSVGLMSSKGSLAGEGVLASCELR